MSGDTFITANMNGTSMACDNCRSDQVAYTLLAHTQTTDPERIELQFCSTDCLRGWT